MNKRRASRAESPNFSFRTRAPLGITEKLAVAFTMDVVSVGKRLVRFLNDIGGEWLAGSTVGRKNASDDTAHKARFCFHANCSVAITRTAASACPISGR